MAPHSSTLAWKTPWTEEPGRLQSMGSLSHTRLSGFTFTFHFHALEKEMATHSSVLAWRIPGTGEPGGLPSMGSHRVGHDWSGLAAAAAANLYFTTKIRNVKIYSIIYINNKIHYWSLTSRCFEKLWDRLPTRLFQSGLAGLCYILKDKNKTKTEMLSQTKCLK